MTFMVPGMLIWFWVAGAAVVLYLVRRKPKTVQVTTLPFFLGLSQAFAESAWLRRLKRILSLLLTLLIISGAVLALSRLILQPGDDALQLAVILVDRSASMAATDQQAETDDTGKTTRIDRGLLEVRRRLAALPESVAVSLIVYDRRPHVLQPPTHDRREVLRSIDQIVARPIAGQDEEALALAQQISRLSPSAVIWHVTDGGGASDTAQSGSDAPDNRLTNQAAPGSPRVATSVAGDHASGQKHLTPVERIHVAEDETAVNLGITSCALRRMPMQPSRVQAFVRIEAAGRRGAPTDRAEKVVGELEVLIDDRLVALRELSLAPGDAASFPVPIEAGEGEMLTLRVGVAGDVLKWDDAVTCPIPDLKPIRVVWVTAQASPFMQLALTTLANEGELAVFQASPADWPLSEEADVVIFDGWQPDALPAEMGVVLINPTRSFGAVPSRRLDTPVLVERVRPVDEQHPVLLGVATARLMLTQTAVFTNDGSVRPILAGPAGPVMSAGEVQGRRIVAMAFDPNQSERLPLMASFPLMIGNALYWCSQSDEASGQGTVQATGALVATHGEPLQWMDQSNANDAGIPGQSYAGQWGELDRIGVWQVVHDQRKVIGSSALLSGRETRLSDDLPSEKNVQQPMTASRWAGEWSMWFVAAALVALLAESVLFHRWAVW